MSKLAKYDRHPKKQEFGETPIPSNTGEMLPIDIFSTDKKFFPTCVDKFCKFAIVQPTASRIIEDLKPAVLQLMNFFPRSKTIYCDNEPSLKSHTIMTMLCNNFGLSITNAPPLHGTSNGQVEPLNSTLFELTRCIKINKGISVTVETVMLATTQYNKSVINRRPADIVLTHPDEPQVEIHNRIQKAQTALRAKENASRQNWVFEVGEKVLVKSNRKSGQQTHVRGKICRSGHGDHGPYCGEGGPQGQFKITRSVALNFNA